MDLLENNFDSLEILIILAILGGLLLVQILYLLTLRNTLKVISVENRTMNPNNVWLLLIPIFSIIWGFIVVNNISRSIYNESKVKEFTLHEPNPANGVGIAVYTLKCLGIVPLVGSFIGIAGVICWIIYWSKVNRYKQAIIQAPLKHSDGDSLIFKF